MKLARAEQILVIFTLAAGTALTQTFLDGGSATFPCIHGEAVIPQWFDSTDDIVIFNRNGLGDPVKPLPTQSISKYDYYEVNNSQNLQFDLKINPVRLTDIGNVTCRDGSLFSPIEKYAIDIEAVPSSILVTCDPCDKIGMETTCLCNCSASEGYPETLTLNWDIDNNPPDPQPATNSSGDSNGTYMLNSQTKVTMKQNNLNLKCSVKGYDNEVYIETNFQDRVMVERLLSSPICTLIASSPGVCTDVVLNCSCTGFPQPQTFVYTIDGTMNVTSGQSIYNHKVEAGTDTTFQCYGSNGIEFESKLSDQVLHSCPKSPPTTLPPTTTVSTTVTTSLTEITSPISTTAATTPTLMKTEMPTATTPTMTLMTTSTPESDNLGLIIGVVIAAVVVGGGAIGFSVYWFGIRTPSDDRGRKKGSNTEVGISTANKEKSDKLLYESTGNNFDPPGGADNNTVTASTNETTNSAAPVYGVVNKSTKKKSDNTDGNGVNSKLQSEPDRVEYAAVNKPESDPQPAPRSSKPPGNNTEPEKMELQYADIDHSNRGRSNEIHQPADAPTEYATVQSVIV